MQLRIHRGFARLFLRLLLKTAVRSRSKLLLEFLDSPRCVDVLQTPRVKRMAHVADVDLQFLAGAASGKGIPAPAGHDGFHILRMNAFFHFR